MNGSTMMAGMLIYAAGLLSGFGLAVVVGSAIDTAVKADRAERKGE